MKAETILERQRNYFRSGATKSVEFRIHQLKTLKKILTEHESELNEAVYKDFKKPEFETYATELGILHSEIGYAIKKLKKWARPKRVSGALVNFPSANYTLAQPYGCVLIIAPWNYPIQLALLPVVGAIAAGNTVVIKPSELTAQTSSALSRILGKWFKEEYIAVVEGGVEENQELLAQNFDYIFFTGSTRVGHIVMKAAAKNLTPVTLELGGKSPCIIEETADLKTAARRIAWGKFLNAGQTCVAPDYLLVQSSVEKKFLKFIKQSIQEFYGEDPKISPDYPRVINEAHFDRLKSFLADGSVYFGGRTDRDELYIEPTILTQIDVESRVMQEEIFGPVLPILTFDEIPEALAMIEAHPNPLAFYIFTKDKKIEKTFLHSCSFGDGVVNDVVTHLGNHHLPFGGVGGSGIGGYHGKHSFDTFSHIKSIMKKSFWLDIPFRYAPYKGKLKWIKKVLK